MYSAILDFCVDVAISISMLKMRLHHGLFYMLVHCDCCEVITLAIDLSIPVRSLMVKVNAFLPFTPILYISHLLREKEIAFNHQDISVCNPFAHVHVLVYVIYDLVVISQTIAYTMITYWIMKKTNHLSYLLEFNFPSISLSCSLSHFKLGPSPRLFQNMMKYSHSHPNLH